MESVLNVPDTGTQMLRNTETYLCSSIVGYPIIQSALQENFFYGKIYCSLGNTETQ